MAARSSRMLLVVGCCLLTVAAAAEEEQPIAPGEGLTLERAVALALELHPARMAAEFAAGAGHDIIYNGSSILTRLYYKNLVDLSDVADTAGKKYGGWIPAAKSLVEKHGALDKAFHVLTAAAAA